MHIETFHSGVNCYISSLFKNRKNTIATWSKLEEIIRYLNSISYDHKKNILIQQFLAMALKMVEIKYSSDIHAFGYYTTLQTLYKRLRDDFPWPSLASFGRMSNVSKLNEKSFLLSIFNTLNTRQKGCILLHDEVSIYKKNVALSWQTTIWDQFENLDGII